jgi:hypothetical protein
VVWAAWGEWITKLTVSKLDSYYLDNPGFGSPGLFVIINKVADNNSQMSKPSKKKPKAVQKKREPEDEYMGEIGLPPETDRFGKEKESELPDPFEAMDPERNFGRK